MQPVREKIPTICIRKTTTTTTNANCQSRWLAPEYGFTPTLRIVAPSTVRNEQTSLFVNRLNKENQYISWSKIQSRCRPNLPRERMQRILHDQLHLRKQICTWIPQPMRKASKEHRRNYRGSKEKNDFVMPSRETKLSHRFSASKASQSDVGCWI